uniref:Uncharacterized protein n=1 Tax=Manihot esculenta TaxID=3983 RepID=A0A2C9VY01_MANES
MSTGGNPLHSTINRSKRHKEVKKSISSHNKCQEKDIKNNK